MENYNENILLTKEDLEKIKNTLKNKKFEDFKIHKHYWFNGIVGIPRHGFEISELSKLFDKTEFITHGFKRKYSLSFGYTLIYKISVNSFVKICYFLDESPMKIYNAIPLKRNLEKAILKRYAIKI